MSTKSKFCRTPISQPEISKLPDVLTLSVILTSTPLVSTQRLLEFKAKESVVAPPKSTSLRAAILVRLDGQSDLLSIPFEIVLVK